MIIAIDYGMQERELHFFQRMPLVDYTLDRIQVCYNDQHQAHPDNYPLVLKNRDELIAQGCKFKLATLMDPEHNHA